MRLTISLRFETVSFFLCSSACFQQKPVRQLVERPEVKLESQPQNSVANTASEDVDTEYLQYSDAKT